MIAHVLRPQPRDCCSLWPGDRGRATEAERHLPAGRFGTVTVYVPEEAPRSVAIFLSGDGGWQLGVIRMAGALGDGGRAGLDKELAASLACTAVPTVALNSLKYLMDAART